MKKVFLRKTLGAVVAGAAIGTLSTLAPLGVSAAYNEPTNNTSCTTKCGTNFAMQTLNNRNCGTLYSTGTNGEIQNLSDFLNNCNTGNCNKISNTAGCNTEDCNTAGCTTGDCNTAGCTTEDCNIEVVEKPQEVIETPQEVIETPQEVIETPQEVVEKPQEVVEKPQEVIETPQEVVEKPNEVVETPNTTNTTVDVSALEKLPQKYDISIQNNAENQILELMNQKRVQAGLQPLTLDNTLQDVARYKSNHMIQYNYFDHTTPTGGDWTNWLKTIGYSYRSTGENIAYNTYDAVELFNQWWNSPGHRANMMNPSYNKVGIGVIYDKDNGKYMGTQTFSN